MLEIKIDTSYYNYDGIEYYNYEYLLQTPVKKVLDDLLVELDSTVLCNNVQVVPTTSWRYSELINKYIRFLFRIPLYDFKLYNHYIDLLFNRHEENICFEKSFAEVKSSTNTKKVKNTKHKKTENKFVRTETHNLFTGELEYDYTNFATGESFISSDPNLLEELNGPKKKKKVKKETKKEFGKIILNFKLK